MPILLHGDAAFAGQGVVAETLNLSRAQGLPHRRHDSHRRQQPDRLHHRAAELALDALLHRHRAMVQAPIFHVNGDDPEAVRPRRPRRDRVPPAVQEGRRHRHVLLPAPRPQRGRRAEYTQPFMYKAIKAHKTTRPDLHRAAGRRRADPEGEVEDMKTAFQAYLNAEFEGSKDYRPNKADWLDGRWSGLGRREGRLTSAARPRWSWPSSRRSAGRSPACPTTSRRTAPSSVCSNRNGR